MSRSQLAARKPAGERSDETTARSGDAAVGTVLEALEDADCRAIMAATRGEELTVSEICDASGIAQSTAYRKVEMLVDADLLEERIRIQASGGYASTYACTVEDVTVTIDADGGVELSCTQEASEPSLRGFGRQG